MVIRTSKLPPSPKLDRLNGAPEARARVLEWAHEHGMITNSRAKQVGRWNQAWYHLNKMAQAGLLKRSSYNVWIPVKRRGKPYHV